MVLFYSGANLIKMSNSVHCLTLLHTIYIYIIFPIDILRNKLFGAQIKIEPSRHNCGCAENHSNENCLAGDFCGWCCSFL